MLCPHCQSPMPSSARWSVQFRLHVDCRSCGARSYLDYQRAMRRPLWPILVPLMLALYLADTIFPGMPAGILGIVGFMAVLLLEVYFNAGHVSITAVDKSKGLRRRQQIGSGFLLLFMVMMWLPIRTHLPWIPESVTFGIAVFALAASGYYLLGATRPGGAGE